MFVTGVYEEVKSMREACGEAHLKTILATGELGNMANVYKASLVVQSIHHHYLIKSYLF
jgi:deoxyribose-phosphate aldolase